MVRRILALTVLGMAGAAFACVGQPGPGATGTTLADIATRVPSTWQLDLETPPVTARRGMVATDAPLATQLGAEVLRAGGNAVDAAVATAFALAVVYPEAGNIGGGGFLVLHTADGATAALDFRETAPLAAHREMYLDEQGELTDRSLVGHLAAGVPGSVAGLWEAHRRYGTMAWARLIEPAIRLADEGFEVDDDFARTVRGAADLLGRFPASAALFLPNGHPVAEGSTWRNPDLAETLRRIARSGPAGFYSGETADLIVAEMRGGGGIITHEDLARYRPIWRDPVVFDYRGHRVISMPPVSSGGVTLALMANMLEGWDLHELGWHSPDALHLMAEAMRRAFADRNHYLGDPDFVEMPLTRLVSTDYAAERRADISMDRATPSTDIHPGLEVAIAGEGEHTTHLSIVDEHGNAVALTTTVNSLYGSKVTVTGAGFLLNNEMDDFTSKPGEPNQFGLVQGEANAIEPGKRMLSAMTPTIVLSPDGRPVLVTGARGGPRIITAVFQVISNVVDHNMDIALAVTTPRIHHQHLPDRLYFEPDGLTPEMTTALGARGHEFQTMGIGVAPSIARRDGRWTGLHDPRRGGSAAGH